MINYTYIIIDEYGRVIDKTLFTTIYTEYILRYHFPCCLNDLYKHDNYSKYGIKNKSENGIKFNEYAYIKRAIFYDYHNKRSPRFKNVRLYQIPRTLYDLFVIFNHAKNNYLIEYLEYYYSKPEDRYEQYHEYSSKVQYDNENIAPLVYELNNVILDKIKEYGYNIESLSFKDSLFILKRIIRDIKLLNSETYKVKKVLKFFEERRIFIMSFINQYCNDIILKHTKSIDPEKSEKITRELLLILKKCLELKIQGIEITTYKDEDTYLEDYWNTIGTMASIISLIIFFNENPEIEQHIFAFNVEGYLITYDMVLLEEEFQRYSSHIIFFNTREITLFFNSINVKLLQKILMADLRIGRNNNRNKFLLYRGSRDRYENPVIKIGDEEQGYSLSYNTSALNGVLNDEGACTYYYMNNQFNEDTAVIAAADTAVIAAADTAVIAAADTVAHGAVRKYKSNYIVDRFFYKDKSKYSKLLFIPPLHPYLQLICRGELWDARSLIYAGSSFSSIKKFNGYYNKPIPEGNRFPDFLKSTADRNEIKKIFKEFLRNRHDFFDLSENDHTFSELFGGKKSNKRTKKINNDNKKTKKINNDNKKTKKINNANKKTKKRLKC